MRKVDEWLAKAAEDLAVARLSAANKLWNPCCFHAQQCGEKGLKSLFEAYEMFIPRTHDLEQLLDELEAKVDVEPVREAAVVLSAYGVDARYPGFDAGESEATVAAAHAECLGLRHLRRAVPAVIMSSVSC